MWVSNTAPGVPKSSCLQIIIGSVLWKFVRSGGGGADGARFRVLLCVCLRSSKQKGHRSIITMFTLRLYTVVMCRSDINRIFVVIVNILIYYACFCFYGSSRVVFIGESGKLQRHWNACVCFGWWWWWIRSWWSVPESRNTKYMCAPQNDGERWTTSLYTLNKLP